MPHGAFEHLVARRAAEIGWDLAGEVFAGGFLRPIGEAGTDLIAEFRDGGTGCHVVRRWRDHVFIRQRHARVLHIEEGGRDLENMMQQDAPGAWPVRKFAVQVLIRHLGDKANGGFENMVVAGLELVRRQRRGSIVRQIEEVDDILDDLREDKLVAARDDGDGAGAEALKLIQAGLVREDVYRCELDPTDRKVFFYPETARSMGLPEDLDWCSHPLFLSVASRDHCRAPLARDRLMTTIGAYREPHKSTNSLAGRSAGWRPGSFHPVTG